MKKLLITTAAIASVAISAPAFADNTKAQIRDVYNTINVPVYKDVEDCYLVDVPIYERRDGTAGEALGGAIIGGVIGNQFGNGSGKDAMTIIGALIGAGHADRNKKEITGYRQEKRCSSMTIRGEEKRTVYSHSIITFFEDGKKYEVEFQRHD